MIESSSRALADAERIARDLKIFLERSNQPVAAKGRKQERIVSMKQIVSPIVDFGITRLRERLRGRNSLDEKTVWIDLWQNLSDRLVFALAPTLRFQQKLAKAIQQSLRGRCDPRATGRINLLETFAEFPGLLDTASRLISGWTDAQAELFARLLRDRKNLSIAFLANKQSLRVSHIRAGLSDLHDGGRTVTMIRFANGLRVIYKPRPCDGEMVWFEALSWLNRNGMQIRFRIPKILPRKEFAWMEFLPSTACKNVREVRRFYFRWGAQAALAQVLGAADLHRDNWLVAGSQPILADAELLGDFKQRSRRGRSSPLDRHLPAVLRTGLLPTTTRDGAGFYRGIAPFDHAILKGVAPRCWPRCKALIHKPSRHVEDLAVGFAAVAELFDSKGMRKRFFNEIVLRLPRNRRVLLRATSEYARLLHGSLEIPNMVSRDERWRRLVHHCWKSATNREVALAEARALVRCDIPKIKARATLPLISWDRFSGVIAALKNSARLLRSRVLLGAHGGRQRKRTRLMAAFAGFS